MICYIRICSCLIIIAYVSPTNFTSNDIDRSSRLSFRLIANVHLAYSFLFHNLFVFHDNLVKVSNDYAQKLSKCVSSIFCIYIILFNNKNNTNTKTGKHVPEKNKFFYQHICICLENYIYLFFPWY